MTSMEKNSAVNRLRSRNWANLWYRSILSCLDATWTKVGKILFCTV